MSSSYLEPPGLLSRSGNDDHLLDVELQQVHSTTSDTDSHIVETIVIPPDRPVPLAKKLNFFRQGLYVITSSKLNWLLLIVPVIAIADWFLDSSDGVKFGLSFIGLIPLAAGLGFLTEQLALHTNQTIGGLLNATFGNATELIISIFALKNGLLRIVQVSLLGSILSNLLLVVGSAFLLGGVRYSVQSFNKITVSTNAGLLMLAVMGMMFPAVLTLSQEETVAGELVLSRYTAVLMLILYGFYLVFQLKTHRHLFEGAEEDEEEEILSFRSCMFWLSLYTVLIAYLSDVLVSAIEGASESWGVRQIFLGTILIPIVGNAAEHASAVTVAYKNKMELSLGIAIGSSTQIALFGVPLMVVAGWIVGQPLSLYFHMFETATVFIAVIVVNILIADGTSNWLSGLMLIMAYLLVAGGFFVHKDD